MDKAGAYAIQGGASRWVRRIEGCYFNVVGLPVARVRAMLDREERARRMLKSGLGDLGRGGYAGVGVSSLP